MPMYRSPRIFKFAMNAYPPYWATGIRVVKVSRDFRRVEVQLRQHFYNSNAFGTHFGGSLYSMCDPFFVLMLVPLLGREYVVWDKAAQIEFISPGRGTLTAVFEWSEPQIADIRDQAAGGDKVLPERTVDIVDAQGTLVAKVWKQLYVRRKR